MIKYYKLFDLLNRKGMKKTDLLKIISAPTLAKLSKGETVKTDIISKICIFLDCQPGDIMEEISKEMKIQNGLNLYITNELLEVNENSEIEIQKKNARDPETHELISSTIKYDDI